MEQSSKLARARALFARWGFLGVAAVGAWELAAHVWQVRTAISEKDWDALKPVLAERVKGEDLVVFAPKWTEPMARWRLGDRIASVERVARADETRFPRAFEVSARGAHAAELATWKRGESTRVGPFTVTALENPNPLVVLDDLLSHVRDGGMTLSRADGDQESPCPWSRTAPQAGGLGFGPPVPGDKFACPSGGFAGITVMEDPDYVSRRCIYVPPAGGATAMRLRFRDVAFGTRIAGHHTLYAEAERSKGPPVTLTFKAGPKVLGRFNRRDGQGWTPFEMDTSELKGEKGELVVEVTSPNATRHAYCFEATTR